MDDIVWGVVLTNLDLLSSIDSKELIFGIRSLRSDLYFMKGVKRLIF